MYVNAEDPNMSMRALSDRAAQTMFWTELARGFAVTLAHIFKVFILNYLFHQFTYHHPLLSFIDLLKSASIPN